MPGRRRPCPGGGSCQQALTEGDPERVQALRRRQQELRPLLQEARELAEHTAHYYDRGYIRREKIPHLIWQACPMIR